jgi:hypothetical protein
MRTLQVASQYIGSKMVAPGPQEEALVGNAEKRVGTALQRINDFFATHWKNYRSQVESTKVNLFKDYKPL